MTSGNCLPKKPAVEFTILERYWITHRIHGAAIYGNIYHQYTPNVRMYTIHGSYGLWMVVAC